MRQDLLDDRPLEDGRDDLQFRAAAVRAPAGTFAIIEVATEMLIAGMAHRISPWLRRVGRRFNQACGGIFVAIGLALPLRG